MSYRTLVYVLLVPPSLFLRNHLPVPLYVRALHSKYRRIARWIYEVLDACEQFIRPLAVQLDAAM